MTTAPNSANSMEVEDFEIIHRARTKRAIMYGAGAVLLIVIIAVILMVSTAEDHKEQTLTLQKSESNLGKITLDDILSSAFYTHGFNGTWISGTEIMYVDARRNYMVFDVETQQSRLLIRYMEGVSDVSLSPNGEYALLQKNRRKVYRHSFVAEYLLLNFNNNSISQLVHNGRDRDFQLAVWSPKNSLVYVKDNNIYYIPDVKELRKSHTITTTGIVGIIYNGIPDWVYEEEVFSSNIALWFSPTGKQIAFASFNDSLTRIMTVPYYGNPGDIAFSYPLEQHVRYPKSGSTNPTVSLHVVDLESVVSSGVSKIKSMVVPSALEKLSPILTNAIWATDEALIAIWTNRVQNVAIITNYEVNVAEVGTQIANFKSKTGWLEPFEKPHISEDGSKFLLKTFVDLGNNTGLYPHITLLERKVNSSITPLTTGPFSVIEILHWNQATNTIYYISTSETDSGVQLIRSTSPAILSGLSESANRCISCDLNEMSTNHLITDKKRQTCLFGTAEFSKTSDYFVAVCEGPGIPFSMVYKTENLMFVRTWEENKEVQELVLTKNMPTQKRLEVPVTDKFKAQVKLILPHDLDESGKTKYPMLVKVYAGPGSHQVDESFDVIWEKYLTSSHNFIIALIDGRGSDLKGQEMMYSIYRRLGTYEIYDQINVTRYLQDKFPYIDANRTAVWGWSYGGYATGLALALDTNNVFKCGISVAPVTDWVLYDSIYTERYMGLPEPSDNLLGYDRGLLLNKCDNLRNKMYFLIHGTMDDNVHYQQSLMLANVLEHKDIMFRQLSYTDEDHGLVSVRPHLYHNLENFLNDCLHFKK